MKRTIKLAVVAALALGATSAFATNGDVMIGQGAKSRAMGGIGIAKSFGAESALSNPANLNSTKDMEVTVAATVFMPDVSYKSNAASAANPAATDPSSYASSAADLSVIPEIYYSARITDRLVLGFALAGTAGMGTDYSDFKQGSSSDNGAFEMKTELALAKIALPLSYQIDGFTFGAAGIMQYGTLQLSHQSGGGLIDNGQASDTGYGLELGATYNTGGLTLGAIYKSAIKMTYKDTIGKSIVAFGGAAQTGITSGDVLEQPEEIGAGISYEMEGNTLSAEVKRIKWGSAEGYSDFGWEDQDVYTLGYEYADKDWAFRAGYNYAKSPISEQTASASAGAPGPQFNYGGAVKNFFNMAGFPGIVETHYSIGGGVVLGDFTIDGSVIYAPEVSNSFDTSALTSAFMLQGGAPGVPAGDLSTADVKHSQLGVTIAGTYKF